MTIDTEPLVESLARVLSAETIVDCHCAETSALYRCRVDTEQAARAAITHLLPLIIERCAEEAEAESCDNSKAGRLDEAFGAMGACNRIRALIPEGGDHA